MLDLILQGPPYEVQSSYLVASNGASSRVRKQLGIALIGNPAMLLLSLNSFSHNVYSDSGQHVGLDPAGTTL